MTSLSSRLSATQNETKTIKKRIILDDRAVKLIAAALEDKTSLALLLLEIDHFQKTIEGKNEEAFLNKTYSHLQKLMRKQDLLFSQTQGKFLILLPRTTTKAAHFIAENIQEFFENEHAPPMTFSIALVSLEESGNSAQSPSQNFDQLLVVANTCLNEAKKRGGHTLMTPQIKRDSHA